jgi:hypothetical protein
MNQMQPDKQLRLTGCKGPDGMKIPYFVKQISTVGHFEFQEAANGKLHLIKCTNLASAERTGTKEAIPRTSKKFARTHQHRLMRHRCQPVLQARAVQSDRKSVVFIELWG